MTCRTAPLRWIPALAGMLAAAGAAAQAPEGGLPRVLYGTPSPNVIYGQPSPAPEAVRPAPEATRRAPPPAQDPAAAAPRGSLTYQSGPAYLPPGYWGLPQGGWGWSAGRPVRPPPTMPTPYVSPGGGMFEPPLPQGRYVGRPPGSPPPVTHYGRPPGQ